MQPLNLINWACAVGFAAITAVIIVLIVYEVWKLWTNEN